MLNAFARADPRPVPFVPVRPGLGPWQNAGCRTPHGGGPRPPRCGARRGLAGRSARGSSPASASARSVAKLGASAAKRAAAPKTSRRTGRSRSDHRHARGERLHRGQAEALLGGRERERRGRGDQRRQLGVGHRRRAPPASHAQFGGARVPPGAVVAVVEQGLPAGDDEPHSGAVRRSRAKASSRSREPLRGSMPPTVSTYRPNRARQRRARPGRWRRTARSATPLGMTSARDAPAGRRPPSATAAETQTWAYGVTIARSWQAASSGVVNWSRWWTVRTQAAGGVGADAVLRVHDVVRRRGSNAARSVAIERSTRSPTVSSSAASGNGTIRSRTAGSTGRKKPVSPPRPSVHTVTSCPAAASASARARVCTTPPRGLVE